MEVHFEGCEEGWWGYGDMVVVMGRGIRIRMGVMSLED